MVAVKRVGCLGGASKTKPAVMSLESYSLNLKLETEVSVFSKNLSNCNIVALFEPKKKKKI